MTKIFIFRGYYEILFKIIGYLKKKKKRKLEEDLSPPLAPFIEGVFHIIRLSYKIYFLLIVIFSTDGSLLSIFHPIPPLAPYLSELG